MADLILSHNLIYCINYFLTKELDTNPNKWWGYEKKEIYKYDSKDNLIEKSEYKIENNHSELDRKHIYEYNSYGKKTLIQFYQGQKLSSQNLYKFDNNQNLIEESTFYYWRDTTNISKTTYDYDNLGNWTRRVKVYNDKNLNPIFHVTERQIKYRN